MSADLALDQFSGKSYLSLETYRKDGRPVGTTVWFVIDSGNIYVRTREDTAKVKRLAANANARLVPSSFGGEPMGNWVDAIAERTEDRDSVRISDLFRKKYGIQKVLTDFASRLIGKKYIHYRLRAVAEQSPGVALKTGE